MIPWQIVVACAAAGALAGLTAGLFGVGGGMIIVPALALLLPELLGNGAPVMQIAIGTSLAVIAATSLSSTLAHQRAGAVRWDLVVRLAPGLAAGALGGAGLAHLASGQTLRLCVGIGALLVALRMALGSSAPVARLPARTAILLPAGGVIGLLSALIGIGGGSLTVPLLGAMGIPIRNAVATSAACGVPIAWLGTLGMIAAGWGRPDLPAGQLGYVSLPGLAVIATLSVACAPLGARLAHRMDPRSLRRGFALLLALVGLRMLWTALQGMS